MPEIPQFVVDRLSASWPGFTADEVAAWPEGLLDQLLGEQVLRAAENARSVACDECGTDHVETVQYIESPPKSELRAYILCPQSGRVRIPLARLRQWVIDPKHVPGAGVRAGGSNATSGVEQTGASAGAALSGQRAGKKSAASVTMKSWTQGELDGAIREYKARRAPSYSDLVDAVKHNKAGAKTAAQKMFGRNAIARELGVRAPAMVSKSPEWQQIASELRLPRPSNKSNRGGGKRIGLDIAIEKQATSESSSQLDEAVRRETIQLIRKGMPQAQAEATIEKLERGEISDDDARELVGVVADQRQDLQSRKVRTKA
ncbi:MAG: hypothetical protein EXQ69_06045 [Acidimicrobiia bacterium]|nr:hypothetical protein [Acidimicrobiia bacterium]